MEDDEKSKQVAETISSELQPKHPLEHKWTLWYFELQKNMSWTDCMHEVSSFDTVEDFWSLYHYIRPVAELGHMSDYFLFKTGIKPMWEDDRNKNGGRWVFPMDASYKSALNDFWLNTVLYMIGELYDDLGKDICGAVINIRLKGDKISLWTGDCTKSENIQEIGKIFKKCLRLENEKKLVYEAHQDTSSKTSSRGVKFLFQI